MGLSQNESRAAAPFLLVLIFYIFYLLHRFLLYQQSCRKINLEVALVLLTLGDGNLVLEFFHQVIIFFAQLFGQPIHNLLAGFQCVPIFFRFRNNCFARVYLRSQKCWDIRQKAPDARRMSAALLGGMQANATQQMGLFGRIEQRWGVFRYTLG